MESQLCCQGRFSFRTSSIFQIFQAFNFRIVWKFQIRTFLNFPQFLIFLIISVEFSCSFPVVLLRMNRWSSFMNHLASAELSKEILPEAFNFKKFRELWENIFHWLTFPTTLTALKTSIMNGNFLSIAFKSF